MDELDSLLQDLAVETKTKQTQYDYQKTGQRAVNPARTATPVVMSHYFEFCPSCRSHDVTTNKGRGYSICETCGYAVDPNVRRSTRGGGVRKAMAKRVEDHSTHNKKAMARVTDATRYELYKACQMNDIKKIKKILDSGVDINCKDYDTGSTPLHWACSKTQQHAIRLLVDRGADVNAKNNRGNTPLHVLIINRAEPLAFWLIKKGADIRSQNNEHFTPVDLALPWTQKEMEEVFKAVKKGDSSGVEELAPRIVTAAATRSAPAPSRAAAPPAETKAVLKIWLRNDAYKSMVVSSNASAQDVCGAMAEKLGIGSLKSHLIMIERVKNAGRYEERQMNPRENLMAHKAKWPLIFGKTGNETDLHCRFIVHISRGAPSHAQEAFSNVLRGR